MTRPSAVEELLARAREGMDRVDPADLAAEVTAGAVVIDTRPVEQRTRDGAVPGAVVVDRNVLEWRLDPTSPHRLPVATSTDIRYVLVCNEGYSSSLALVSVPTHGSRRALRRMRQVGSDLRQAAPRHDGPPSRRRTTLRRRVGEATTS